MNNFDYSTYLDRLEADTAGITDLVYVIKCFSEAAEHTEIASSLECVHAILREHERRLSELKKYIEK